MPNLSMKQMLEAGSHFGHQTKRWNPKMKKYIFGARNGIYIIDLQKSLKQFNEAAAYITKVVSKGENILFVGTKNQAQELIVTEAKRCGVSYVNQRWLGGMLTNFNTIKKSIDRLKKLEEMRNDGLYGTLTKKEILKLNREEGKLEKNLGGIKNMDYIPKVMFIVDPRKEKIAFNEAKKLDIKTIAIVDTNCDPDKIDFVIPANDDAIRAIKLIVSKIADAVLEGKNILEEKRKDLKEVKSEQIDTGVDISDNRKKEKDSNINIKVENIKEATEVDGGK